MRHKIANVLITIGVLYPLVYLGIYLYEGKAKFPWPFLWFSCITTSFIVSLGQSLRELRLIRIQGDGTYWSQQPIKFAFIWSSTLLGMIVITYISSIACWNGR